MPSDKGFLYFSLKQTEGFNWDPLPRLLANARTDVTTEAVKTACVEARKERHEVVAACQAPMGETVKETFARYYRSLCLLEDLCTSPLQDTAFTWSNSLYPRRTAKQRHLHFEMACVLFNIGAHLSRVAVRKNGSPEHQNGEDVQCFQEAAGVFSLLRQRDFHVEGFKHSDLATSVVTMAESLMLAQGQECCVWRAIRDSESPSRTSQLAKRASDMYAETMQLISEASVGREMKRTWEKRVRRKSRLFDAISNFYSAVVARQCEDIAKEIARLQRSVELFKRLKKKRFEREQVGTLVVRMYTSSKERLKAAQQENETIYLRSVPQFDSLPVVNGLQEVMPVIPTCVSSDI